MMRRRDFLIGSAALGGAAMMACGQRAAQKTKDSLGTAMPSKLDEQTVQDLHIADIVLVGEVVSVEESPGVWAGRLASYQAVKYRVVRVLKRTAANIGDTLTIEHPLIEGARTVHKTTPQLDETMFRAGQRLIILARMKDSSARALNADRAVLAATAETLAAVEAAIAPASAQ